ncbi:DUF6441 family protein [Limimaricola pyoseonensis]|uniref:Uncharacterized protein n=1 Tax=Limimaricola pyoseonensis TaxID=521013 RepID=A0A1G7GQ25_9RHOB|nr:DUF6441 family protein [Limimaricola pyoseonensis]SDE90214.1 hypothetical protein SAMN04488567_2876 [Limimaricola pyoseonensis]
MKLAIDSDLKSLSEQLAREYRAGERAVTLSMRQAGRDLQTRWREQVTVAGIGRRLVKSIRSEVYPKGTDSADAAAVVYTKAPKLIGAFDKGPLIKSKDGFWLAIPLPAAGRGFYGRRMTPLDWERRHGMPLRFIYRRGKSALLVADDARLTKRSGQARQKRGRRRRDGTLTGAQTVPIFVLVPQVKLRKRLDFKRDADQVGAGLPARIAANWRD